MCWQENKALSMNPSVSAAASFCLGNHCQHKGLLVDTDQLRLAPCHVGSFCVLFGAYLCNCAHSMHTYAVVQYYMSHDGRCLLGADCEALCTFGLYHTADTAGYCTATSRTQGLCGRRRSWAVLAEAGVLCACRVRVSTCCAFRMQFKPFT